MQPLQVGYGFGASFVALFAQLGGGIYTKARVLRAAACCAGGIAAAAAASGLALLRLPVSPPHSPHPCWLSLVKPDGQTLVKPSSQAADVGADLVGKVEAGIPEDDPR